MLKVTLHQAALKDISPENVLGRLDIGYAKLDALADYKTAISMAGFGECAMAQVKDYPRWTASIWDLVSRAICVSLNAKEELVHMGSERSGAFIRKMTAVVQHWPDGFAVGRATIGTATIAMRRQRCYYEAVFNDDLTPERTSPVFHHAPKTLTHWDLLARAYAYTCTGEATLPARPMLFTPIPVETDVGTYVPVDLLPEPARTGLFRWITKKGLKPSAVALIDGPCVTENQYVEFLRKAV